MRSHAAHATHAAHAAHATHAGHAAATHAGQPALSSLDLADQRVGGQQQAGDAETAFCSAIRSTLAGTMTPILIRSPYSSVSAL
jgi:hypothetical protein